MLYDINQLVDYLLEDIQSDERHGGGPIEHPLQHPDANLDPEMHKRSLEVIGNEFPDVDPKTVFMHGTDNMYLPHRWRRDETFMRSGRDARGALGMSTTPLLQVASRYAMHPEKGRIILGQFHQGNAHTFGDPHENPQGSYNEVGRAIRSQDVAGIPQPKGGVMLSKHIMAAPDDPFEFEAHFKDLSMMQQKQLGKYQATSLAKKISDSGKQFAVYAEPVPGHGTVVAPTRLKHFKALGEFGAEDIRKFGLGR